MAPATPEATSEASRVFPTLRYRDAEAAIRFLVDVVGFTERVVYRDGTAVKHAELAFGSGIVMLGEHRGDGAESARHASDAIYLAAEDPDGLHAKVLSAGAEIVTALHDTDYGSRDFIFRDPGGAVWAVGTYWPKVGEAPL